MRGKLSREQVLKNECLYSEKCKCGKEVRVYTQEDDGCEYMTDVWIECDQCNELVYFSLPVN